MPRIESRGPFVFTATPSCSGHPQDFEYHENVVKPLLGGPGIQFLGEIGEDDKEEFLENARALLFPIDWPEPFGLVLLENMACGTPVIAYRRGWVPEVIEDGVTGFIVDGIDEAVAAVERAGSFDRRRCRAEFERRFTVERMARDHLAAYEKVLEPSAV